MMAALPAVEGTLMKRWILRALLLLLIGAVINVTVAWACAIWAPTHRPGTGRYVSLDMSQGGPDKWPIWDFVEPDLREDVPRTWPLSRSDGTTSINLSESEERAIGNGITVRAVCTYPTVVFQGGAGALDHTLVEIHAGWPAACLVARVGGNDLFGPPVGSIDSGSATRADWRGGWAVPEWLRPNKSDPLHLGTSSRVLPFAPLVGGFMINTLTFAMGLGLLLAVPVFAGRYIRARRGLCRYCGYDLAGNTTGVCPECGKPANPRPEVPA